MAGRTSARAALESHRTALKAAADLASVEGLDSITIGRVADAVGMSKSGVVGQFGSRENLQLEIVALVADDFRQRVWIPVQRFPAGIARLLAACEAWAEHGGSPGFPGGCLLTQATYDYDGRGGPVHEAIAGARNAWRARLRDDVRTAVDAGDLPAGTDADAVVYALESLAAFITPARLLYGDGRAAERALTGMRAVLGVGAAS